MFSAEIIRRQRNSRRTYPSRHLPLHLKNWKISETDFNDKYLIPTEKSIWLTDQNKDADINELIDKKNLGTIKSIRYEDLKEIVFIDTDNNPNLKLLRRLNDAFHIADSRYRGLRNNQY